MGTWAEYKPAPKYTRPHEHEVPKLNMRGAPPGAGSVWRCKCGMTWEVIKSDNGSVPSHAFANWTYGGQVYYLSSFNYDQPSPFPTGGSC